MQVLYNHGASVTVEAGKYFTALQMAAKSGNLEAVKWLFAQGAYSRVKGGRFDTALEAALKKERWAVVSYLEQHLEGLRGSDTQYVEGWNRQVPKS